MGNTTLAQASRLTDKLREPGAKPVFLTGAGISLASGIGADTSIRAKAEEILPIIARSL